MHAIIELSSVFFFNSDFFLQVHATIERSSGEEWNVYVGDERRVTVVRRVVANNTVFLVSLSLSLSLSLCVCVCVCVLCSCQ